MPTPPIFITPTDFETILADLVADFKTETGRDLQPADIETIMLSLVAYQISLTRLGIQYAGEQCLVDFANPPSLDYLAQNVGVTRLAATPATVTIEYTLDASHLGTTIPSGNRVSTADGAAVFELVADVNVAAGVTSGSGQAVCQVDGTVGNGYTAGTINTMMDPIALVLSAQNTGTSGGGADQETDAQLRNRIKLAEAQFSTAGSESAYKFHALGANPGIVDVAVPNPPAVPPNVDIYPLMADGSVTPASVLAQVDAACNAVDVRPISDVVSVIAPTPVNYTLDVELELYDGGDIADAQAAVEEALDAWTISQRQRLGIDIVDTQVIDVAHGAYDLIYEVVLPTFTTLVIAFNEYAVCTAITVTVTGFNPG